MHEQLAEIEFVAQAPGDSETEWYVEQFGGGVMVVELQPTVCGRIFLTETEHAEHLVFVTRRNERKTGN